MLVKFSEHDIKKWRRQRITSANTTGSIMPINAFESSEPPQRGSTVKYVCRIARAPPIRRDWCPSTLLARSLYSSRRAVAASAAVAREVLDDPVEGERLRDLLRAAEDDEDDDEDEEEDILLPTSKG